MEKEALESMAAIVVDEPHSMCLRTLPMPKPGPGEALIRTAYTGICATDFEILEGRIPRIRYPHVPGHEWSGIVEAVGGGEDLYLMGKAVVGENFQTCGRCPACHEGKWNQCLDAREVGFDFPGGYAQYFVTRAGSLRELPPTIALREACLIEPTAVCVYAVERVDVRFGDHVMIIGDGPIGLLCLQLSLLRGAGRVTVVGGHDARLAVARSLGAALALNYHREPGVAEAMRYVAPVDVVIEASGSPAALETAFDVAAMGGRLGVVGDYAGASVRLDAGSIVHRNLVVAGSNASPGTWDRAIRLVASDRVRLAPLISSVFPLEMWETAWNHARQKHSGTIKVVLSLGGTAPQ